MTCDECGKAPAMIRCTEMVGGELSTWNLCEECARRKGVTGSLTSLAGPLVDILMGLLEEAGEREGTRPGSTCPRCGLSYREFRQGGRVGCGTCYTSFRQELLPLLRRIHGSTEHAGRVPTALAGSLESKRELEELRAELDQAVRREEYERAAELRDLLRAKEGRESSSG
jgi:protein arginine kinase activator